MTYPVAKAAKQRLEAAYREASEAMRKWDSSKGEHGLTPDYVKASPEWRRDWQAYMDTFKVLREFNADFTRRYHKEIRAENRKKS